MASRNDVARFAQASRDLGQLARRDLERFWSAIDVTNAAAARAAVEEFLPLLVERYGEVAATVAADFYDDLRDASPARGRFTAVTSDTPNPDAVRANGRWAIGPLYGATPDGIAAARRLGHVLDRMALQQGRDTIATSVDLDPSNVRWARVPSGADTCAFCLMLASRGPVYRSKRSASTSGGGGSTGARGYVPSGYGRRGASTPRPAGSSYHAFCDCVPTPIWAGQELPGGYDPDALYERYERARAAAPSGDPKAILSELRELEGIH